MTTTAPIPVPEPDTLTGDQLRGRACVWCEAVLVGGAARTIRPVDLGARTDEAHAVRWFPRACSADCPRRPA